MADTYRKDPEAIAQLTPEQYRVTQQAATEAPFSERVLGQQGTGHLRRRRVRRAAVRLGQQVRQRLRLAELHGADRARPT